MKSLPVRVFSMDARQSTSHGDARYDTRLTARSLTMDQSRWKHLPRVGKLDNKVKYWAKHVGDRGCAILYSKLKSKKPHVVIAIYDKKKKEENITERLVKSILGKELIRLRQLISLKDRVNRDREVIREVRCSWAMGDQGASRISVRHSLHTSLVSRLSM